MELSYFISMVQYEVLKSFDFNTYLQNEIETDEQSQIQLAIEAAEIEIPLVFGTLEKEINSSELENQVSEVNKRLKTHIDVPFSKKVADMKVDNSIKAGINFKDRADQQKLDTTKKSTAKLDQNSSNDENTKLVGKVITVEVANQNSKRDEKFDPSVIGKIKLIIKPVTRS